MFRIMVLASTALALLAPVPAAAQGTATTTSAAPAVEPEEGITILFETGRSHLGRSQDARLDEAARLFRDGNPIVMIVTGNADTVGDASANLDLSISRARAVADGLMQRGIPIERLQVLGQGNSELPVVTEDEVPNAINRSARITWR